MFQFGKKSAKVYHSLYSSTGQLQVALWTFMFIRLGLNKESLLTPSLYYLSIFYLSLSNPSLSKPSVSHLGNGQFYEEDKKND